MALQDIHHRPSIFATLGHAVSRFFTILIEAKGMRAAAEARGQQIEILNAKTDKELAEMGLRRSEIAAYVFRDLMYA